MLPVAFSVIDYSTYQAFRLASFLNARLNGLPLRGEFPVGSLESSVESVRKWELTGSFLQAALDILKCLENRREGMT